MLAMISPHAALPNSTKRQLLHTQMHDCVIKEYTSTGGLSFEEVHEGLPFAEDIQCQWLLSAIDECNSILSRLHVHDGKDGTKDFLLHGAVIQSNSTHIGG